MPFTITPAHVEQYHVLGFTIFRGVVPASLIRDLRRVTINFRDSAATDARLGETAKWQLQPIAKHFKELRPFRDYEELDSLRSAIATLLTPQHRHADIERTTVLFFEPPSEPMSSGWHRDWTGEFPGIPLDEWQRVSADVRFFNQANCPLYQDACTWLIQGSHLQLNRPEVLDAVRFPRDPQTLDAVNRERMYLDHARSIPGAVQACLEPGDYLLYRNSTWHTGIYAPYRKRATLADFVEHPDYARWRKETDKQWHADRDKKSARDADKSRLSS